MEALYNKKIEYKVSTETCGIPTICNILFESDFTPCTIMRFSIKSC